MNWLDNSEVVAGKVLRKQISPVLVNPETFQYPYNKLIQGMKDGKSSEELYLSYAEAYNTAIAASESINGHHDIDWLEVLETSKLFAETGLKMSKMGGKMQDGDHVDLSELRGLINEFKAGKTGRIPLSEITPMEIPFVKTGWQAIDEHLGGIPGIGLIIVSGNPGVGKTSWAIKLASCFAETNKDKVVDFHTLEMIDSEIAMRFKEIYRGTPSGGVKLSKKARKRVHINADPITAQEVINDAAKIDDLGLVIIDFADYLIRGEVSDASMGEVYLTLARGAKQLGVPIVLLAQYSRKYEGGLPRPYHIRYTSLAEILGWMLICLWNPTNDFYAHDAKAKETLPVREGYAYSIAWKVRGGFRQHLKDSPGAIMHEFQGAGGWHDKGRWFRVKS